MHRGPAVDAFAGGLRGGWRRRLPFGRAACPGRRLGHLGGCKTLADSSHTDASPTVRRPFRGCAVFVFRRRRLEIGREYVTVSRQTDTGQRPARGRRAKSQPAKPPERSRGSSPSWTALGNGSVLAVAATEGRIEARDVRAAAASELAGVRAGLARLRDVASVAELLRRATQEVCRSCGFDRAILFGLEGAQLITESAHFEAEPHAAEEFMRAARQKALRLDQRGAIGEMFRRRQAIVMSDADAPTLDPLLLAAKLGSCVAAPIVVAGGQPIGSLHAGFDAPSRRPGADDREVLWAFTEGLGYALELTWLRQGVAEQLERMRGIVTAAGAYVDEPAERRIAPFEVTPPTEVSMKGQAPLVTEPRLEDVLTRRELEVAALLAQGTTNSSIAEQLVISNGTVKTHVKSILRKLGAANRGEAASRYWLTPGSGRRPPKSHWGNRRLPMGEHLLQRIPAQKELPTQDSR